MMMNANNLQIADMFQHQKHVGEYLHLKHII